MKKAPTYAELLATLGTLLDAYAAVDGLLDDFVDATPEGMTKAEERKQRTSNKQRDTAQSRYFKALHAQTNN